MISSCAQKKDKVRMAIANVGSTPVSSVQCTQPTSKVQRPVCTALMANAQSKLQLTKAVASTCTSFKTNMPGDSQVRQLQAIQSQHGVPSKRVMKGRTCVSGMAPMNAEVKTIFVESASWGARSAKVVEESYESTSSTSSRTSN